MFDSVYFLMSSCDKNSMRCASRGVVVAATRMLADIDRAFQDIAANVWSIYQIMSILQDPSVLV